ncbi:MAG TPA: hypothetical protein VGJ20_07590 [Xanthobacteraceae bacterium]
MRLKIIIGVAALALGGALTSVPAFAYQPVEGYNSQGGVIELPQGDQSAADQYNQNLPQGGTTVP